MHLSCSFSLFPRSKKVKPPLIEVLSEATEGAGATGEEGKATDTPEQVTPKDDSTSPSQPAAGEKLSSPPKPAHLAKLGSPQKVGGGSSSKSSHRRSGAGSKHGSKKHGSKVSSEEQRGWVVQVCVCVFVSASGLVDC